MDEIGTEALQLVDYRWRFVQP